MPEITYFVPGSPPAGPADATDCLPLQVYLPTMPANVAAAYIEATTQPGDLVLDPFCQTPQVIREGLTLGRRVLAANFNPIVTCAVELSLTWDNWPNQQAVSAAFTHLVDSLKGDKTLRARLAAHYSTCCPTCKKPAQAESFVWNRDWGKPVEKHVRCPECNAESRGPVDEEDLVQARRYEPRSLPYWLLLERAAATGDERERAAAVLAAYTPRALAAISDVLIHFDALPENERALLRPLLLEMLAECSTLHPPPQANDEERVRLSRPRSLKPSARFIERNVWRSMADSLKRLVAGRSQPALARAADLDALLAQREPAAHIVARNSREIARLVEPDSVALAIGLVPDLNPTFWALSAVWGAWLWGARTADVLRPLLGRRRADVEWLWRVLASALGTLASTLSKVGKLVLAHPVAEDEWLGGLVLAGAGANLKLEHALAEPCDGLRIAWRRGPVPPERLLDVEAFGMEVMEMASLAALKVIRARGEPVTWIQLAAGIYQALAEAELLAIAARMPEMPPPLSLLIHFVRGAFEGRDTPFQRVEGSAEVWWTNRPIGELGLPLSDLVEMVVYDVLHQADEWDEAEVLDSVYRRFRGILTPERALVAMCLESYTQCVQPGVCALREEDRAESRLREIEILRNELKVLGDCLGWETTEQDNNRLVWAEGHRPAYTFSFSATAQLSPYLLTKRPPLGTPVLVIPGGRAGLIKLKLHRNVQFRNAVIGAGWQFLKFRHLRTLATDPSLSRESFRSGLGLDPLIESEGQIALL